MMKESVDDIAARQAYGFNYKNKGIQELRVECIAARSPFSRGVVVARPSQAQKVAVGGKAHL